MPSVQAPRPGSGRRNQEDEDNQGILSDGDGAGSSRAAAAAAGTPRSVRRGSKAVAAADAGADSDAGVSTGKARGGRGRKAAASTPGGHDVLCSGGQGSAPMQRRLGETSPSPANDAARYLTWLDCPASSGRSTFAAMVLITFSKSYLVLPPVALLVCRPCFGAAARRCTCRATGTGSSSSW